MTEESVRIEITDTDKDSRKGRPQGGFPPPIASNTPGKHLEAGSSSRGSRGKPRDELECPQWRFGLTAEAWLSPRS